MARIACVGDTRTKRVSCNGEDAATSALFTEIPNALAVSRDVILGAQNTFVKLTSTNVVYAGDVFSFDVTVQNLILQKLGTSDGTTLDPAGVRVFFQDPPAAVGVGTVDYTDPVGGAFMVDGFATFTQSNQAYYQYNEVLAPNQISGVRTWRLHVPSTVTSFSFFVFVSAPVQFQNGWIDLAPPSAGLRPANTVTLVPTVRDVVGRIQTGQTVTWVSSNPSVASVDASGVVLAVVDGVATITATSTTRTGTALITVASASGANTTITGSPANVAVGVASTITVQAKNAANANMTVGGDVVVLSANLGTLGSVTDNGDGTYTATLNSNAVGTSSITGTINGATIGHPGSVTFTAAGASSISINAGDAQTAAVGAAVATVPSVVVRDQFSNPVSGVQVVFSVTGGGGSGTVLTTTTNGSGIATVGSWTLGAGGVGCTSTTITSCTRNALHAVANSGSNPALDFKAYVPPIVPASALYAAIGNSTLAIGSATGLLQSAFSINGNGANGTGTTLTVNTPLPTGTQGGTATIATDGSFSYLSLPAYLSAGAATEDFTYAVTDGVAATNATPLLQINVPLRVWYVEPGYAGTSTGADVKPYKDFSATAGTGVESVAPTTEIILVSTGTGTATGGTLKSGQQVYGQGITGGYTVSGFGGSFRNGATPYPLLSAGSAPNVGSLVLGASNTLRGFTIATTATVGLTGTSFGTLTVSEMSITSTTSGALSLTTGTLAGSFTNITSGGGTNNVLLSAVATSGSVVLGTGALSGASGDAFKIVGAAGNFSYSGTISNAATLAVNISSKTAGAVVLSGDINPAVAGKGILVSSNTGGSVTFTSANVKISSGTTTGVDLPGNSASTVVSFTGGALVIATTSGTGLSATTGTLNITGASNTINATAAQGLNLNGTTIGTSNIVFASVSSAGGVHNLSFINLLGTGSIALNGGALSAASAAAVDVQSGVNDISYAGTISHVSGGALTSITTRTGGALLFTGNLTCTSNCAGISATNNSAGSTTFSGTTKTFSTGVGVAVTLSNNTGHSVSFTNGGLAITTTLARGMNVTGGGTLVVTRNAGSANTITSTSATALNVTGTTIGAGGLVFQSISSTGTASENGIILDNTGSSGGLTITGAGFAGSGGTISNKTLGSDLSTTTGSGVYLNLTQSVSLSYMQLNDFSNYAIRGTGVTGFSLLNTTISGANGTSETSGSEEGAVRFDGLFTSVAYPTATILNSTISGGYSENVRVRNISGSLNRFVVDNVTLGQLNDNGSHGGDSFVFEGLATSNMNLTLTNSTINGARGDLVDAVGHGGATMDVVLRQNHFYNSDVNTVGGGGGVTLSGGDNGVAAFTFDVSCNRFKGTLGSSLNIAKATTSTGAFTGTVRDNFIGVVGTLISGGAEVAPALWIQSHGAGAFTVLVQGNTIAEYGEEAIDLQATQGSATLNATLFSNVVSTSDINAIAGLNLEAGAITGDAGTLNLLLGSESSAPLKNDFSVGDPANGGDVTISHAASSTTTFSLTTTGSLASTISTVIVNSSVNPGATSIFNPSTFGTLVASTPTLPPVVTSCVAPAPLMASAGNCSTGSDVRIVRSITENEVATVVAKAVARLGIASRGIDIRVATLPAGQLAEATARGILVSPTAAGWEWYVDSKPDNDDAFVSVVNQRTGDRELHARAGGPADGRMDLLTAVMHELEHTLGRSDLYSAGQQHELMTATLPTGVRRLPRAGRDTRGASQ